MEEQLKKLEEKIDQELKSNEEFKRQLLQLHNDIEGLTSVIEILVKN